MSLGRDRCSCLFWGALPLRPGLSPLFKSTPSGTVEREHQVRLPARYYLLNLSAGPNDIYAGTAVIKRFTNQSDELLRIDPSTLAIAARASFPASVAPLAVGADLWVALGDGRVLKLDPDTLEVLSSQRILSASGVAAGARVAYPPLALGVSGYLRAMSRILSSCGWTQIRWPFVLDTKVPDRGLPLSGA